MKVFFIKETDRERLYLRRYRSGDHRCPASDHYCEALLLVGVEAIERTSDGSVAYRGDRKPADTDLRWPTKCEACGVAFTDDNPRQLFGRTIYRRPDNGEEMLLKDAPPGAAWNAWWIADRLEHRHRGCGYMVGPDGRSLVVRLPDGSDWMIDSRARNCTMPDDMDHFCWVRHGRPEEVVS